MKNETMKTTIEFKGCTDEYSIALSEAIDSMSYDDKTRKSAVKCVEALIIANGVKIMSGRSYADKYFRKLRKLEAKLDFYDAQEIVMIATDFWADEDNTSCLLRNLWGGSI